MSGKTYRCNIEVRGYELDGSGHVNHSVFINYFEHARWKMLEEEKITLERFREWKLWPIIVNVEAHYLKPAFAGEILEIRTRPLEHGKAHYSIEQNIFRGETLIAQGKIRGAIINEKGRPVALPDAMLRLWPSQTEL